MQSIAADLQALGIDVPDAVVETDRLRQQYDAFDAEPEMVRFLTVLADPEQPVTIDTFADAGARIDAARALKERKDRSWVRVLAALDEREDAVWRANRDAIETKLGPLVATAGQKAARAFKLLGPRPAPLVDPAQLRPEVVRAYHDHAAAVAVFGHVANILPVIGGREVVALDVAARRSMSGHAPDIREQSKARWVRLDEIDVDNVAALLACADPWQMVTLGFTIELNSQADALAAVARAEAELRVRRERAEQVEQERRAAEGRAHFDRVLPSYTGTRTS
jgi:hypothetical protein